MATAEEYARWIVENQDKAGTPDFDAVARAYELAKQQTKPPKDWAVDIAGAAVEPNLALGSGLIATPLAGIAGIAGSVLPGPAGQGAQWTRAVQEGLTYQPRTEGGQHAMSFIGWPFEKLGEAAQWAGGQATDLSGSPALGAAVNTAVNLGPMALGARYMPSMPRIGESALVQAPKRVMQNLAGSVDVRTGNLLRNVIGDLSSEVAAKLRTHQDVIPGSRATAGQAAVPAASAEMSALQQVVSDRAPSKYGSAGIEGAQEAARAGAIGDIAKTPADYVAALKRRAVETAPLRQQAFGDTGATGVWNGRVLRRIRALRNQRTEVATDVVRNSLDEIAEKIKAHSNEDGFIYAEKLNSLRRQISNVIKKQADENKDWDKRRASGLQAKVQRYIDDAIEDAGGTTWKPYLSRYAELSGPLNRMETGQALADALRTSVGASERPTVFANLVKKASEEQSFATGRPRMVDLTAAEQDSTAAVMAELLRDAKLKRMAGEGTKETARRIGASLPRAPGVGVFMPTVNVVRALYNRLMGKATESTLRHLTERFHDPQEIARLIEMQAVKRRSALADRLLKQTYPGALIGLQEEETAHGI